MSAFQLGEVCCSWGCGSGACERCPCCQAGFCVGGADGIPDDPTCRARWLEIAAEYNPLAARIAELEGGAA